VKSGENVLWKTEVPLPGKSSPVVWGRRVFLSGATAKQQKLFCFDRTSGKRLWEAKVQSPETAKRLQFSPEEQVTVAEDAGFAAPTPVTDGKSVYVVFATGDVAAVDFGGKVLWVRNIGKPESPYGLSSSLALYKDIVIFQFDQGSSGEQKLSALYGLDAATGSTIWRTERPVGSSWSSPIVASTDAGSVVLTSGNPWVIAYDAESGSELWRCKGLSGDVAPSPVCADGKVFVTNQGAKAMAIRMGGSGDVTATHVAWTADEGLSEASSPLCDGKLFLQATPGEVTCFDATTGKLLWKQAIDCGFWASPTLVGDVVCLPGSDGKVRLFKFAGSYEPLGDSAVGEPVHATPAFCDSQVFIRGDKHLFCIGTAK